MKINTNYINPYFSKSNVQKLYHANNVSGVGFKGIGAKEGQEELLDVIFRDKKEAYKMIAKEKHLDISCSKQDDITTVVIKDLDSDEVLKTIKSDDICDRRFQFALKRSILLANAPRNLYAASALLAKYSAGLPEKSKKTSEDALKAAQTRLDKAIRTRAELKMRLVQQINITENNSPEYAEYLLKEKNIQPVSPIDVAAAEAACNELQVQVEFLELTNEYGQEAGSRTTPIIWRALLEAVNIL